MFNKIGNRLDRIMKGKEDTALRISYMIYIFSMLGLLFMTYSDRIFAIIEHLIGMP